MVNSTEANRACFCSTQGTLTQTLGISAPMLSHLMSANWVKIEHLRAPGAVM